MTVTIVQVDAFTSEAFAGNPAGVCVLPEPRDARWMQLVAREMAISETAFLHAIDDGYSLRWFTPVVEVDLCGHATLASAHVLLESGKVASGSAVRFHTRSGVLTAASSGDGWIELNFPATPDEKITIPAGLADAMGAHPRYVGRSRFDYLMEFEDEATVRKLEPDFARLRGYDARGVIATARASTPGVDFVSRYFAPAFGIDEDPVTGSTHCCLGPFWGRRLKKSSFVAHQVSARGGKMRVTLDGDRVTLAGQAVTVLRAELAGVASEIPESLNLELSTLKK
jgi:PhzF family phenazine biosynthesis protein